MIRLGIVDADAEFRIQVQEAAQRAGDMDVVATVGSEEEGERVLRAGKVHVVLVGLSPELDGLALLRRLFTWPPVRMPKAVAMAVVADEDRLAEAVALGADYAMLKPFRMETLLDRIRQLGHDTTPVEADERRRQREHVYRDVAERLTRLGVAPHFKGYRYLLDAIGLVAHDMSLLLQVTTELYPTVARRHGTTAQRVERAIRNAIEVTLTRGNLDEIERLFGHVIDPSKGKLSNSSFIAHVADHVRLALRVG